MNFKQWIERYFTKYEVENELGGYTKEILEDIWNHQQKKIDALAIELEVEKAEGKKLRECVVSIAHNGYEDENGRHEIYPEELAQQTLKELKNE